jgi:hypothetical protein
MSISLTSWGMVDRMCPANPRMLKREYDFHGNRSYFSSTEMGNQKELKMKGNNYGKKVDMFFLT